MNNISCPICGGKSLRTYDVIAHDYINEVVSIAECFECEMAWQHPLKRTYKESASYFTKKYDQKENGTYFDPEMRRQIATLQMDYIRQLRPEGGNILDVGAGDGTFLDVVASSGWKGIGIEPAEIQKEIKEELTRKGITLIQGSHEDLPADMKFDVITLWDVIEHVDKPFDLLKTMYGKLNKGGMIVLETGNYKCANRIENSEDWWAFQIDHRWYFSPQTLKRVLDDIGFKEFRLANRVFRPWWNGSDSYQGPSVIRCIKKIVRSPWNMNATISKYYDLRRLKRNNCVNSGLDIFIIVGYRE
jgi:2-polyprenyl-3-methyl-5-hydroxy-6-metoxy-1,4-benzoquinol methylase